MSWVDGTALYEASVRAVGGSVSPEPPRGSVRRPAPERPRTGLAVRKSHLSAPGPEKGGFRTPLRGRGLRWWRGFGGVPGRSLRPRGQPTAQDTLLRGVQV
jgi:hypothetical protein